MTTKNVRPNPAASTEIQDDCSFTCVSAIEMEDLRHTFHLFDVEKKGKISVSELQSVLKELEQADEGSVSSNLQQLVSELDSLPSASHLTMDEFIRLMTSPNPSDARDEWTKVFDLFDQTRKGFIEIQDLCDLATELGETMEESELRAMIFRVSPSGRVSLDQFKDLMNKKLFS